MEQKHTMEPWRVGDAGVTVFGPPNGTPSPETVAGFRKKASAARAVACVNALAGLDPAGLAGVLDFVARVVADSGATVCNGDNGAPELCGGLDPAILLDEFYRHGKRALAALRGKGG